MWDLVGELQDCHIELAAGCLARRSEVVRQPMCGLKSCEAARSWSGHSDKECETEHEERLSWREWGLRGEKANLIPLHTNKTTAIDIEA